jgi:hypothetical protein
MRVHFPLRSDSVQALEDSAEIIRARLESIWSIEARLEKSSRAIEATCCGSTNFPVVFERRTMSSPRNTCPSCHSATVVDLANLLFSPRVDHFRCPACSCWWMVPKGEDGPATRIVFGDGNWARKAAKAG